MNTIPIENFLDKARIALKTNQKFLNLDIKEVQNLHDSLAVVMTRLAGTLDEELQNTKNIDPVITVKMDGGGFK